MFKKLLPWYLLGLVVLSLAFVYGCGNATGGGGGGGGGGVATNYTITGNIPQMNTILSLPTTETKVIAIGANCETFTATVSSDGSFSLNLIKGVPYVLGFYDGVTLEGYVCVPSVGWNSLPIIDPTGEAIDLGTLTLEAGSLIVTCEINTLALAKSLMNLDSLTGATFYGSIDGMMKNLLNIDVNKNGEPDYLEDNIGIYLTLNQWGGPGGMATGEIEEMLTGYNDSYVPSPACYAYWLTSKSSLNVGTVVSLEAPTTLTGWTPPGNTFTTMTAEVQSMSGDFCRYAHFNGYNETATSPTTPPTGTYTAEVGGDKYTFDNCDFSGAFIVGSSEGIIYPVFNLETWEVAGKGVCIKKVHYKWMKVDSGNPVLADPDEVKAVVGNYSSGTAIAGQSPNIGFQAFQGVPTTCPESYIYYDRDGTSLDVSSYHIKLSDVNWIQGQYMTSTNIQIDFRFGWDHTIP